MRTKALFIIVTLFFVSNQSTFTQECDYFADFIDKYPTTCLAFVENPEGNHGDYVRLKIWGKGGFEPIKDRYEFHVFCFDLKKKKRYAYSRLSPLENRELRRYRDGSQSPTMTCTW